jgi:lipopolysaccharide export system permease protein
MMRTIDKYIIRKFLGTFFFTLILLIFIVIVFDISEKIDDFLSHSVPLSEIVFDYYINFIPYFVNLFSYLLTFIAVIFFTSQMASRSEIVAILGSGISFRRMLFPYVFSAVVLGVLSFVLTNFIIPYTNRSMLEFENKYVRDEKTSSDMNVHKQISPGTFIYVENFNLNTKTGYKFSLEQFRDRQMIFKLMADKITYDSVKEKWKLEHYYARTLDTLDESLVRGRSMDTSLPIRPKDFVEDIEEVKIMGYFQLREHIAKKELRGDPDVQEFQVKKYERWAHPFATIILTMIGVAVSSRKVRGGIGFHLGFGLALTFLYILFMQISAVFGTFGSIPPYLAVWIPNILFGIIAIVMIRMAPK